jgi:hypothetical protein
VHSTAESNGTTFPQDVREAAACYLNLGRLPVPVPHRGKECFEPDWPNLRPTARDLDRLFPPGRPLNLGLLLGEPSSGLLDADLDCIEAIRAAPALLPSTGWLSGHQSKPRSHYWYEVDAPPACASQEFTDLDGTMLLELRSTLGQTVAPPSTHEGGEPIVWYRFEQPAQVPVVDLQTAVSELAAVAFLARHWPGKNSRQQAYMALAGGLLRAGWPVERVERFLEALVTVKDDEEARKRVKNAAQTGDKLDEGRKVTGWPKLAALLGQDGLAVVDRVREWLGIARGPRIEDVPIPEPPPWPDPPGEEAYHGLAGDIVRTISPASEADPAALLVQVLVSFGNAVGREAHFTVEADRHHGNEFAVLVGKTSKARKGTSWGQVKRLFQEAAETWATERVQTGLSSGEGLVWAVRDPICKREKVKEPGTVRYEDVEADPGVEDKRLLVVEPEFANVLKQTERQGNILSPLLRQAWDGNELRTLTKNSPARATGAHVSLIGHITADELRRYLTETEVANGYGNRHLWICADRSKVLPEGGRVDPAAWAGLVAELVEALAFARTAGEVTRDEEARAIWWEVYGPLSEGKPGLAGALLARGEAHVMRLALLYALLDRETVIRAPHLMAALALWDYAERSVYFLFGDRLGDPLADDLLRLLRGNPDGLTRTQLGNYLGKHGTSDRVGRALGLLLQHGLVRREEEPTGGRPVERWFATARGRKE